MEWLSAQIKRELSIRANSHYTQSAPIRAKLSGPAIRPNRAMLPDSGEQLWASYLPEFRAKSRVLAIRPNLIFSGDYRFHAISPESGDLSKISYLHEFGRKSVSGK